MCGIIAVVSRPSGRAAPDPEWVADRLAFAAGGMPSRSGPDLLPALTVAAAGLEEVDAALRGSPGVRALLETPALSREIQTAVAEVERRVEGLEQWADSVQCPLVGAELEAFNGALVRIRDVAWALSRDRLRTAAAVAQL